MVGRWARQRRILGAAGVLVAVLVPQALGTPAVAAVPVTVPPVLQRSSAVATADALPTVQIDGVVWTQVVIGTTVYAAGDFSKARPAGAAAGTRTTTRKNLLAYSLTTGKLNTTFKPAALDGQVKALAVSTDKKTVFAAGDFTKAGTRTRMRFAAFDARTGALRKAAPAFNSRVNALAVVGGKVFAGGWFTRVGSTLRTRLAAVDAGTGKVTSWKPTASGGVNALVASPDKTRIIVGGGFDRLNSTTAYGMGAVSVASGKTGAWKINSVVKDHGTKSAILSLTADRDTVYGTGYARGGGNYEGSFAADPRDGSIKWLQDCHGDSYGVAPVGGVVYVVGHAHMCSNIGGFPEAAKREWHRALALTKTARGTVATNTQPGSNYGNFGGAPAPSMYNWFPDLFPGTFTGSSQSAWSIVGTSRYVSAGGEFVSANGVPQQGLVRFAVGAAAPQEQGPLVQDATTAPRLSLDEDGAVVVDALTNTDRDDAELSYTVLRRTQDGDGTFGAAIRVTEPRTVFSTFWNRPRTSWTDGSVEPGATYRYQVRVRDAAGNRVTSAATKISVPSAGTTVPSDGTTASVGG